MEKKYPTKIPDKYMQGWDNLYNKNLDETKLDELPPHFVHYAVLEFSFFILGQENTDKKALELATGDGVDACYLAQLGFDVTALDILSSSVDLTKRRADALNVSDKITVIEGDMNKFALKPKSYDVISAVQCLQYLFDRALPRMYELLDAIKPGGYFLYGGNVKPHFKTDPPVRFITLKELRQALKGWKIHSLAREERLVRPGDRRGYVWVVAQKPENK
ncbi:MAG: class I SAM-dependent methyltransferase [Candidatus Heimdallarchaeota archaeon]|nr:class I SAM-dependent methyltransferase [Candidatus Heimdallarchaeota archaeon]